MRTEKSSNPVKEIPSNLVKAFSPLYRIEALTGLGGYVIIAIGFSNDSLALILAGFLAAGISGIVGSYRDSQ